MADNEEDLVDYDEEEEEQNVAAEEAADAEGKEVKKWVIWQIKAAQNCTEELVTKANDVGWMKMLELLLCIEHGGLCSSVEVVR